MILISDFICIYYGRFKPQQDHYDSHDQYELTWKRRVIRFFCVEHIKQLRLIDLNDLSVLINVDYTGWLHKGHSGI